jgi:predicted transglutaminase-like cysteine proteinase
MFRIATVGTLAAIGAFSALSHALATDWRGQRSTRLQLAAPSLAPLAHTRFCLEFPEECHVRRMIFRARTLTEDRRAELVGVNKDVNRAIVPRFRTSNRPWSIYPRFGDCNDYAVTKRHVLLGRGWASRSLLLAHGVSAAGEHHLVLVVRAAEGDLILDSLTDDIVALAKAPYRWLKVQSPRDPNHWSQVAHPPESGGRNS